MSKKSKSEEDCVICFEETTNMLGCEHKICPQCCVINMLEYKRHECPICRQDIYINMTTLKEMVKYVKDKGQLKKETETIIEKLIESVKNMSNIK